MEYNQINQYELERSIKAELALSISDHLQIYTDLSNSSSYFYINQPLETEIFLGQQQYLTQTLNSNSTLNSISNLKI